MVLRFSGARVQHKWCLASGIRYIRRMFSKCFRMALGRRVGAGGFVLDLEAHRWSLDGSGVRWEGLAIITGRPWCSFLARDLSCLAAFVEVRTIITVLWRHIANDSYCNSAPARLLENSQTCQESSPNLLHVGHPWRLRPRER